MTSPKTLNRHKNDIYVKSEPMDKLINRIPGSGLWISSLPAQASRMHVESLAYPRDSTSILKALPDKLDIKRHSSSILYLLYLYKINLILTFMHE